MSIDSTSLKISADSAASAEALATNSVDKLLVNTVSADALATNSVDRPSVNTVSAEALATNSADRFVDNTPSAAVALDASAEIAELAVAKSASVAEISADNALVNTNSAAVALDASAEIAVLTEVIELIRPLSLTTSMLLINATTSANWSKLTSEPDKIASILPFSVAILPSNTVSAEALATNSADRFVDNTNSADVALDTSTEIAESIEVTSALVALISADNATSNESIEEVEVPDKARISADTNAFVSDALAICVEVTLAQFTVPKKSAICFERICAILYLYNLFLAYLLYCW